MTFPRYAASINRYSSGINGSCRASESGGAKPARTHADTASVTAAIGKEFFLLCGQL
jgi:hypothetical protein